ncbi:MAG: GNAT family N-acetyltransferase [Chloroflexota bacterium]
MDNFTLRPAAEADSSQIKDLIHLVGINPTGLDWKRFVVVVDVEERVIACGQIKPHGEEVRELASIAVTPEMQGRGLARRVIEHLLAEAPRPLYLMCRTRMGPLYEKFAFRPLAYEDMPRYFQRMAKLAGLADVLMRSGDGLLVMKLD